MSSVSLIWEMVSVLSNLPMLLIEIKYFRVNIGLLEDKSIEYCSLMGLNSLPLEMWNDKVFRHIISPIGNLI